MIVGAIIGGAIGFVLGDAYQRRARLRWIRSLPVRDVSNLDDAIDRVTVRCSASGIPITRSGVQAIAYYLEQECSGEREADNIWGAADRLGVHEMGGNL